MTGSCLGASHHLSHLSPLDARLVGLGLYFCLDRDHDRADWADPDLASSSGRVVCRRSGLVGPALAVDDRRCAVGGLDRERVALDPTSLCYPVVAIVCWLTPPWLYRLSGLMSSEVEWMEVGVSHEMK